MSDGHSSSDPGSADVVPGPAAPQRFPGYPEAPVARPLEEASGPATAPRGDLAWPQPSQPYPSGPQSLEPQSLEPQSLGPQSWQEPPAEPLPGPPTVPGRPAGPLQSPDGVQYFQPPGPMLPTRTWQRSTRTAVWVLSAIAGAVFTLITVVALVMGALNASGILDILE